MKNRSNIFNINEINKSITNNKNNNPPPNLLLLPIHNESTDENDDIMNGNYMNGKYTG